MTETTTGVETTPETFPMTEANGHAPAANGTPAPKKTAPRPGTAKKAAAPKAPTAGKAAAKTSPKAPAAAKGGKAKAAPKANPDGKKQFGVERDHDLPWGDKKVAVFKALRALKATSKDNPKTANEIAGKAGCTPRDVRHYCYHARAAGLVGVIEVEGVTGYCFHLTARGAALDPVKEQKAQSKSE